MPGSEPAAPTAPSHRRLSRRKRLAFGLIAGLAGLTLLLVFGELAARWQIEGSFSEAVQSILGLRPAEAAGRDQELVYDAQLGFKLNPERPDVHEIGLRHPDLEVRKPAGVFRIVLLGDSVGFPMDGFFAVARDRLAAASSRRIEFLNATVHGYTTYQERLFLERDLLVLRPDLVGLQYCVNDNYRFLHRLTTSGRRLLTLEAKSYLFPEGDGLWPRLARSSYLAYAIRKLLYGAANTADVPWQDPTFRAAWADSSWDDQEEHIGAMAASLAKLAAELAVFAIPHEAQLDPGHLERDAALVTRPQTRLVALCDRAGIPILNAHEPFRRARNEALYTDRIHLSQAGHELAGRLLADFLLQRELVPRR